MDVSLTLRKDSIVLTAIELMNEFGVQALSTREIAKREGVSESAIFKHYPKKTDLILAVLDFFSKYDKEISDSIEVLNLGAKEKILYMVNAYATHYQSFPAITAIAQGFDEMRYNPELEKKVKSILTMKLASVKELVEKAQACGEMSQLRDAGITANILVGTFNTICLRWRSENYEFSFKDQCNNATIMLLDAFQ